MKHLISFPNPFRTRFIPWARTHRLLVGVLALIVLFMAVLGWDAYLFYRTNVQQWSAAAAPPERRFSEKDLDWVIQLLDERAQKFNDTLRLQ